MAIAFLKGHKCSFWMLIVILLPLFLLYIYMLPSQTRLKYIDMYFGSSEGDSDGVLKGYDLKHWIICLFPECNSLSSTYHHWTFLCVNANDSIEIFYKGELLRQTESLVDENLHQLKLIKYFYFAIKNGAETLFVAKQKTDLEENAQRLHAIQFKNFRRLELPETVKQFNSSFYFGCQSLSAPESHDNNHTRPMWCTNSSLPGLSTPALVQAISHCDPLMPDIVLPPYSFVPITFSASIFSQCAFAFLPLTQLTINSQHEHYSCLVQHLLAQAGCHVSVHWAGIREGKLLDLDICHEIIKQLPKLTFDKDMQSSLPSIFINSIIPKHRPYFKKWFDSLDKLNRLFMTFSSRTKICSPTILYPFVPFKNKAKSPIENLNMSKTLYSDICIGPNKSYDIQKLEKPWYQRPNILLVIAFNNHYFDLFPLIEIFYRPSYPNIIYCADRLPNQKEIGNYRASFITFSNVGVRWNGSLINECQVKAIELRLNFDGIFFVSDDCIFKHKLLTLPLDKVWYTYIKHFLFLKLDKQCNNGHCDVLSTHKHLSNPKLLPMYDLWISLSHVDKDMNRYLQNLIRVVDGKYRLATSMSDLYYIPKHLFYDYRKLTNFFVGERVYIDVNTATMILSIVDVKDTVVMAYHNQVGSYRGIVWKWYSHHGHKDVMFLHPTKMKGVVARQPHMVDFFCRCLLPYLFSPNGFICQHAGEPEKIRKTLK